MLHVRLFDTSIVSLAMASGVTLWSLPLPGGLVAGGSMALCSLALLALRDDINKPPRRDRRSRLAPFEGAREPLYEPDATPAPANSNLTPYQAGRSDFRLAPVTDHAFRTGDTVDFIFDAWDEGEVVFHGRIEAECGFLRYKVRCSEDQVYLVGREHLVLVEATQ